MLVSRTYGVEAHVTREVLVRETGVRRRGRSSIVRIRMYTLYSNNIRYYAICVECRTAGTGERQERARQLASHT